MNKERFNIWLRALKSGKYSRGVNRLRVSNTLSDLVSYCCLGVACDLAAKDLGISWEGDEFGGACIALPDLVADWLGINPEIIVCFSNGEKYFHVMDENGRSSNICNVNDYSKKENYDEVVEALERTFPDLVEQDADSTLQG